MLTVESLVKELGLKLAAGEKAASDREIRWVHISELRDPTPWLSGGELLLTTGIQLDTADTQRDFVRLLASSGAAGLGFGTGFDHSRLPRALVKEADGVGRRCRTAATGRGDALADNRPDGQASGRQWKTPALWGVADSAPYMHDGSAPTLRDAILKHGGDTTVFLSSHVLTEVEATCDRIGVIRAGRMVATGTIEDLKRNAARRVTIDFREQVDSGTLPALPGVELRIQPALPKTPSLKTDANGAWN